MNEYRAADCKKIEKETKFKKEISLYTLQKQKCVYHVQLWQVKY